MSIVFGLLYIFCFVLNLTSLFTLSFVVSRLLLSCLLSFAFATRKRVGNLGFQCPFPSLSGQTDTIKKTLTIRIGEHLQSEWGNHKKRSISNLRLLRLLRLFFGSRCFSFFRKLRACCNRGEAEREARHAERQKIRFIVWRLQRVCHVCGA